MTKYIKFIKVLMIDIDNYSVDKEKYSVFCLRDCIDLKPPTHLKH